MKKSIDEMLNNLDNKKGHPSKDEWMTKKVNSKIEFIRDTSNVSDGSHTFGELYHHRAMLFATICNMNKDISWKSYLHSNGDMIKNFFIVGVDTPEGQFSYHYPLEYWSVFKVEVLSLAPEWDGHTSEDIDRLLSIIK